MDLTPEQRLLLLSTDPADVVVSAADVAPDWLVEECCQLGLVERIGATTAWHLTPAGVAAREGLLGEGDDQG